MSTRERTNWLRLFLLFAMCWTHTPSPLGIGQALASQSVLEGAAPLDMTLLSMRQVGELPELYQRDVMLSREDIRGQVQAIIYGHPTVGFLRTRNFTMDNDSISLTIVPPSYEQSTQFYAEVPQRESINYIQLGEQRWPDPTPEFIRSQLQIVHRGSLIKAFFATSVAIPHLQGGLPSSAIGDWDLLEHKPHWCLVVVNPLGEIVWAHWPQGLDAGAKSPPHIFFRADGRISYVTSESKVIFGRSNPTWNEMQQVTLRLDGVEGEVEQLLHDGPPHGTLIATRTPFWQHSLRQPLSPPQAYASFAIWHWQVSGSQWSSLWRPERSFSPLDFESVVPPAHQNTVIMKTPVMIRGIGDYSGRIDVSDAGNDGWLVTLPHLNRIALFAHPWPSKPHWILDRVNSDRKSTAESSEMRLHGPISARKLDNDQWGIVERGELKSSFMILHMPGRPGVARVIWEYSKSSPQIAGDGSWITKEDDEHLLIFWTSPYPESPHEILLVRRDTHEIVGQWQIQGPIGKATQWQRLTKLGMGEVLAQTPF